MTGVEGQSNLTEVQFTRIINEVQNNPNTAAYIENFAGKILVCGLKIKDGTIVKIDNNNNNNNKPVGCNYF